VFEAHPALVGLIRAALNHGMFLVRAVHILPDAERAIALWRPHLAVVDLDNGDSPRLLAELGATGLFEPSGIPILGLVARPGLKARLDAFRRGVDDVLSIPFSADELQARATAITRRSLASARAVVPVIRRDDTEIDITRRAVRRGRSLILLSALEQRLLYTLAAAAGRVVSRDEILDAVWGTEFVAESNVVDRHVRTLRAKLGDQFRQPRFIATVPGQGYRFVLRYSNEGWRAS
jgi:DNA-binding response OmpR family regulator